MVPCSVTADLRRLRLIVSRTGGRSRSLDGPGESPPLSPIHASLMLPTMSRVSAVRTMRALLRALSIDYASTLGIGRVAQEEIGDAVSRRTSWWLVAESRRRSRRGRRSSSIRRRSSRSRVRAIREPGIEQPRHVLGALDVAVHPEEAVSGLTEHACYGLPSEYGNRVARHFSARCTTAKCETL